MLGKKESSSFQRSTDGRTRDATEKGRGEKLVIKSTFSRPLRQTAVWLAELADGGLDRGCRFAGRTRKVRASKDWGRKGEKAKVEPKPRQQSVTVVEWRQRGSLATATDGG